jgi:hypothetical protein
VEVAYRARREGVGLDVIRHQPLSRRVGLIADTLYARALNQRKWNGPPYSCNNAVQVRRLFVTGSPPLRCRLVASS